MKADIRTRARRALLLVVAGVGFFVVPAPSPAEAAEEATDCRDEAWAQYNSCLVNMKRKWLCDMAWVMDISACTYTGQ